MWDPQLLTPLISQRRKLLTLFNIGGGGGGGVGMMAP